METLLYFNHELCLIFLALLCATAQQSYCRHAGVRRPSSSVVRQSVDIVFSETVKWIDTNRYLSTISPDYFSSA